VYACSTGDKAMLGKTSASNKVIATIVLIPV